MHGCEQDVDKPNKHGLLQCKTLSPSQAIRWMDTIAEIKEKEIKPLLWEVVRIVRKHVPDGSHHILLFGSWATLQSLPTSDIDVGILGPGPLDDLVMARIREQIDRLPTLRKIEVVDLWSVEDRFREKAERNAERLA